MPAATATFPAFLRELGLAPENPGAYCGRWLDTRGALLESRDPSTGELIASVRQATAADYATCAAAAQVAFARWREVPAPRRGEIVRRMGNALREKQEPLARLVTLEMGKILEESRGEVQEAIDVADFAVGQSRMLYGLSMHSERPGHAMREQWHPLGVVGVVTAFNFPVAVWAWNAMIALIAGDACLWKPSSLTPLAAVATTNLVRPILEAEGLGALVSLAVGSGREVGNALLDDPRVALVSFTGSTAVGRDVASRVARRFGRTILELGGNNGLVLMEDADLALAIPAILFGAVGTAGQRCTTTRRLLVQESIADEVERRLLAAYAQVRVGDPADPATLCGPLVSPQAALDMLAAVERLKAEGGTLLHGGTRAELRGRQAGGNFVVPALARARNDFAIVQEETFAPILYLIRFKDLDHAIELHNGVPQGLSSAIFTGSVRAAERFTSATGSDCGIANVNAGTSGAEIGGAFGGEKETGGGRESGSDSWKQYMRRQTSTVNWSRELPLAQGIKFG